MKQVR